MSTHSSSESEEKSENNYRPKVYVVYCDKYTKDELEKFLLGFKEEDSIVGPVKIVYDFRKKQETNRNLCVLSSDIFDRMIEAGHSTDEDKRKDSISVARYYIRRSDYPRKHERYGFYVKLPTMDRASYYRNKLKSVLMELKKVKFLDLHFEIDIPLKSRISGNHRGYANIYLNSKTEELSREEKRQIVLTRLMLDGQLWSDKSELKMYVLWLRRSNNYDIRQNIRHDQRHEYRSKSKSYQNNGSPGEELLEKLEQHYKQHDTTNK